MALKPVIFAACSLSAATWAQAEAISFVHEGVGAVTLDGVGYGVVDFRITASGDTEDRITFGAGWYISHHHASILLEGVGMFDFLVPTRSVVNNGVRIVAFSRGEGDGADLFVGPSHDDLADWFMETGFGPIDGAGMLLQWELSDVLTTGGLLVFKEEPTTAYFRAAIPAPTSLAVLMMWSLGTRRRHADRRRNEERCQTER